jgi:hypothetical protein
MDVAGTPTERGVIAPLVCISSIVPASPVTHGTAATLDEAKAKFRDGHHINETAHGTVATLDEAMAKFREVLGEG